MSTNTLGTPDLDLRPAEMLRSTMDTWVQECSNCGYVSTKISDKMHIKYEFFYTERYKTCDGINFASSLASRFYKCYLSHMEENKKQEAFSDIKSAAWACDDKFDDINAVRCRRLAISLVEEIIKEEEQKDTLSLIKADLLRRAGDFERVLSEYSDMRYEDEFHNKILSFQLEKARNKDAKRYSVSDVEGRVDIEDSGKAIPKHDELINEDNNDNIPSSREEIYRMMRNELATQTPSKQFASGAVFDIVRNQREDFLEIVYSGDAFRLQMFFARAYDLFCGFPQIVNLPPDMVNKNNNDTDPRFWNADIIRLGGGDIAALCFMPIQDQELEARIIGIIVSDRGDGYYYCMLNKDSMAFSDVFRNKAMLGIEKVGEVKGRGFELMGCFVKCIESNFAR